MTMQTIGEETAESKRSEPTRVHQLVSAQAGTNPAAVALVSCSSTLTYKQLEEDSNRLAHHLCGLGVGADVVVGVCIERSPLMVVAALSILKAGGAYLPIDPTYPQDRINFIVSDARPRLVLSHSAIVRRLLDERIQSMALDLELEDLALQPATMPDQHGQMNDLAYVIYTSGSTGQPKGVEITHKGLMNLIAWHHSAFQVTSSDRATQMASPGFDAAVWEVWPYLTAGASLYFPGESVRSQSDLLRNWLVEKLITISFVPTPLAERMLDLDWPTNAALRFMLTGADTLYHYPPAGLPFHLVNNYGPTESTVVATSGTVASSASSELPSIGRPITNTEIYILDGQMRQVPTGSSGDLYIGGPGLARGYRNRPELTAERFVSNPCRDAPGDRLYKTGDLARMLPDGQIAFIGRSDDQVKIRGFRVELTEITNTLSRHPAIRETVVIAREDKPGQKRLVAYVVLRLGVAVTNAGLRDFLGQYLPDYMMPAAFVTMDSLPLGASGKVDRSELPSLTDGNILRDETFISPRNPTEEQIVAIIAELLALERVGVNDNFFLLGGNSLLATQVIARVRESFDIEVTLLNVFDNPTVAGIAAVVEQLVIERVEALSDEEAGRLVTEEK